MIKVHRSTNFQSGRSRTQSDSVGLSPGLSPDSVVTVIQLLKCICVSSWKKARTAMLRASD